jgi:hypothetical protein
MSKDSQQGINDATIRDAIFQFLIEYKEGHDGNTPSVREIAEACSTSISNVNYHLTKLELDHKIRMWGERRRMIEIVGGSWVFESKQSPARSDPPGEDSDDNPKPYNKSVKK